MTQETFRNAGKVVATPLGLGPVEALAEGGEGDGDAPFLECVEAQSICKIRFAHEPLVLDPTRAITNVFVRARARRSIAPGDGGLALGLYFTNRAAAGLEKRAYDSSFNDDLPAAYTIQNYKRPVYPWPPEHPWTVEEVNALEVQVRFDPRSPTNTIRVTQAWLEVCSKAADGN